MNIQQHFPIFLKKTCFIIIKGNLEEEDQANTQEERDDQLELYIRWWQLNVFLPMLHFIKPPTAFPEKKVFTYTSF